MGFGTNFHIVIIAGDHGHPYTSYTPSKSRDSRYSKIGYVITGGITERALRTVGVTKANDIANTKSDLSMTHPCSLQIC